MSVKQCHPQQWVRLCDFDFHRPWLAVPKNCSRMDIKHVNTAVGELALLPIEPWKLQLFDEVRSQR
jgi:hypothetical protein